MTLALGSLCETYRSRGLVWEFKQRLIKTFDFAAVMPVHEFCNKRSLYVFPDPCGANYNELLLYVLVFPLFAFLLLSYHTEYLGVAQSGQNKGYVMLSTIASN